MQVCEIVEALGLQVLAGEAHLTREVRGGYAADLLSCVMAGAEAGDVWITLQTHSNIVAVAALLEIAAVIVAEGAAVAEETVRRAEAQEVVLLSSSEPVYETVAKLVSLGV